MTKKQQRSTTITSGDVLDGARVVIIWWWCTAVAIYMTGWLVQGIILIYQAAKSVSG